MPALAPRPGGGGYRFPSPKLVCDALDRASPDPEALDPALRKLLRTLRRSCCDPPLTPWATARLRPAFIRWQIMLRSNSARTEAAIGRCREIRDDLQEPKTVGLQAAVEVATRNLLPKLEADLKALTKAYNTKREIGAR